MPIIVVGAIVEPVDPTEAESPDGVLHVWSDPAYGGVKMRATFSVIGLSPERVAFIRIDDTSVRGSDPAPAIGSIAHGYDHEAPLGSPATYYAIAYDAAEVEIGRSSTVAIEIPEPKGEFDLWVKSLEAPSLSLLLSARVPGPVIGDAGRLSLVTAQGSRYPGGSHDRRVAAPLELVARLPTVAQRRRWYELIDSGPVFVQMRNAYGEPDFYALVGDSSHQMLVTMSDPRRDVTFTLNPIRRPPTVDSAPIMPGYTIAESRATAPRISQARNVWPTVGQAAGFPDA